MRISSLWRTVYRTAQRQVHQRHKKYPLIIVPPFLKDTLLTKTVNNPCDLLCNTGQFLWKKTTPITFMFKCLARLQTTSHITLYHYTVRLTINRRQNEIPQTDILGVSISVEIISKLIFSGNGCTVCKIICKKGAKNKMKGRLHNNRSFEWNIQQLPNCKGNDCILFHSNDVYVYDLCEMNT